ncbi:alpha/beta hydrolase [Helcobacillus massiliensis]|uniref:DUF1023 domain-containing protein n=2 Tax=Helcobacillus massiliensis TaxID=521392 RepID=A0A839QXC4_9MICO|nr:alpha/beta hydrolase [Helcobacillus massiliensis]MBB3023470.1 hypothetical protein [Helcobacillus massiliensis]
MTAPAADPAVTAPTAADAIGMDPAAVEAAATALEEAAATILTGQKDMAHIATSMSWDGPDADEHRRWVRQVFDRDCQEVASEISRIARELHDQVRHQIDASTARGIIPDPGGFGSALRSGFQQGAPHIARGVPLGYGPARTFGAPTGSTNGYLDDDDPAPDWLEGPVEKGLSLIGQGGRAIVGAWQDEREAKLRSQGVHPDIVEQARRNDEIAVEPLLRFIDGTGPAPSAMETASGAALLLASPFLAHGQNLQGIANAVTAVVNGQPIPDFANAEPAVLDVATTEGGTVPANTAELVLGIEDVRAPTVEAGTDQGRISVTQLRDENGQATAIVHVPPTEGTPIDQIDAWTGAQGNNRDWLSNVHLASADRDAAAVKDIDVALKEADLPPGTPVLLVGHSQGGLAAARFAQDPQYNGPGAHLVTDVVTVGSPVDSIQPAHTNTQLTSISHGDSYLEVGGMRVPLPTDGDIVPALDFNERSLNEQLVAIDLPDQEPAPNSEVNYLDLNHNSGHTHPNGEIRRDWGYTGSIAKFENSNDQLIALNRRLEGTYTGENVTAVRTTVVTTGVER